MTYPDDFETFWRAFWTAGRSGGRPGKAQALKAWKATAKERPSLDELLSILDWQEKVEYGSRKAEHRPHASTWLRNRQWEDELGEPGPAYDPNQGRWEADSTWLDQPCLRCDLPVPAGEGFCQACLRDLMGQRA